MIRRNCFMNEVLKMKVLYLWFTFMFFTIVKTEVGPELSIQSVPHDDVRTVWGFLEPGIFYNSHVVKNIPVVMKNAFGDLDVSRLAEISESFTTYLEIKGRGGADSSRNASVHQILKIIGEEENGFVDTSLPIALKSQLQFPKSLLCKSVAKGMKRTRLIFTSGDWCRDFAFDPLHGLLCQLGGHSSLHLVGPSPLALEGGVSEYFTATLNEGDCIFLPSGWAHQQNSTGKYLSISMYWTTNNEKDSCECDEQSMGDLTTCLFPDDPPLDLLSFIQFNELHHFIKEYYLNPSFMDLTSFMDTITQDKYFTGVLEWNEECKDIAEELFRQLDYNADGSLSKEDFRDIAKDDLEELAGKLDDRLADFADIVEDSKVEKKGSLFTEAKKATNSAEEIRKLIEDSFSDIFSDIDTTKRTGKLKNLESDSEEDELKRIEKLLKDSISQESKLKKDEL